MRVIGYSPNHAEFCGEYVSLEELFFQSDVLSLHCAANAQTRGIVNRGTLAMMKRTAILVNTARGTLIDSAALAEALNADKLYAAGVDVLESEPIRHRSSAAECKKLPDHATCGVDTRGREKPSRTYRRGKPERIFKRNPSQPSRLIWRDNALKFQKPFRRRIVQCAVCIALALVMMFAFAACKEEGDITPGPTAKPEQPTVIVNNEAKQREHYIVVGGYGEVIVEPDFSTISIVSMGESATSEEAAA